MELSQGEIIQKPKMQELSSLFMTHRLIVMYAPVKFHEYIPYVFGVMAWTRKWDVRMDRQTDGQTYRNMQKTRTITPSFFSDLFSLGIFSMKIVSVLNL